MLEHVPAALWAGPVMHVCAVQLFKVLHCAAKRLTQT